MLLNTRDENGNSITSISNMEDKAKIEIGVLSDKLDLMTALNLKENNSHRCEMEILRVEKDHITSQLNALQNMKGSLNDINALQVSYLILIYLISLLLIPNPLGILTASTGGLRLVAVFPSVKIYSTVFFASNSEAAGSSISFNSYLISYNLIHI